MSTQDGDDDLDDLDIGTIVRDRARSKAPFATLQLIDSLPNAGTVVEPQVLAQTFGAAAVEHVRGSEAWALRYFGEGIGTSAVNLNRLADLSADLDRATTWISGSLYPGHRHTAAAEAAITGHSIVVLLVPGVGEKPIHVADRRIYPSVEAGRYLASLYAAAGDTGQLDRLLGSLGGNARGAYIRQIASLAEKSIGVESVIHLPGERHGMEPTATPAEELRKVRLTPTQAQEERAILTSPPKYVSEQDVVDGVFVGWDRDNLRFKLARDDESGELTGTFDERLVPDVAQHQNRRVAVTIEFERPEFSWMPRRQTIRRLTEVRRLERRRTFPPK